MNLLKIASILSVSLVLALPALAEVAVYLEPSATGQPVFIVSDTDPLVRNSSVVTDSDLANDGWHTANLRGQYRGYVESINIAKSLEPSTGSPVHLRPDSESPIITKAEMGDVFTPLWTGDWWEFEFEKTLPVFFKAPPPPPPATPTIVASVALPAAASNVATPPPAVRPRNALPPTRPGAAQLNVAAPPKDTARDIDLEFTGTLARARSLLLIQPPYPYILIGPDDTRLAYVDTSNCIQAEPIESHVGKPVIVYGQKQNIKDGSEFVIVARTIRNR